MQTIACLLLQSAAILSCAAVLQAYSEGPDPRYTGAPGDSSSACRSCHMGQNLNAGPGNVKIVLPNGNFYTPGVKQHILVQISDPQQRRWGFQMTARLKSNQSTGQAGDFSPTDSFTQVICDNASPKPCPADALVQFIEHTSAGTRAGVSGGATFEFDWTPPATDSGNVVFYVAGNAANGDGNLTGDHIYTSSLEVTSSNPSLPPPAISVTKYTQHNLVSDIPGLADQTDANLINPKGIALNSTGAFWISNNRTGTSSLYNGSGQPFPINNPRVVNIPAGRSGPPASLPAAQVFNGTPAFQIASGNAAVFILATESGTISGWSPSVDAGNARLMIDRSGSGAIYKGIALGSNDSGALLYVTNFSAGTVEVFDGNYQPATVSGNFNDPNLPPGFAPFISAESAASSTSPTLYRTARDKRTCPAPAMA